MTTGSALHVGKGPVKRAARRREGGEGGAVRGCSGGNFHA